MPRNTNAAAPFRSNARARRNAQRRRLALEPLEARELMAGDLCGGNLGMINPPPIIEDPVVIISGLKVDASQSAPNPASSTSTTKDEMSDLHNGVISRDSESNTRCYAVPCDDSIRIELPPPLDLDAIRTFPDELKDAPFIPLPEIKKDADGYFPFGSGEEVSGIDPIDPLKKFGEGYLPFSNEPGFRFHGPSADPNDDKRPLKFDDLIPPEWVQNENYQYQIRVIVVDPEAGEDVKPAGSTDAAFSTGEDFWNERNYFNPLGTPAPAITDTSAFATCP